MKKYIFLVFGLMMAIESNSQNIWRTNGNIGIGTENPACWFSDNYVLEITGNRPVLKLNSSSDINTVFFTCSSVNTTTHIGEFHLNYIFNKDDNAQSRLVFGTYPAGHALNVLSNGNVGIGTISPKNLLDVNGTIHAREVKVDLIGWSDYVFHPTYTLKPLSQVEQYIKTNGHLENIPSATEVEQQGVNVGEMQRKLLEKVEELTLYVIELKKENEELSIEKDEIQAKQQAQIQNLSIEIGKLKEILIKEL